MRRQDPLLKRTLARLFYALVQFFVQVRYDHRVGNYRCLSRQAVAYFREHRERTRNVNAIMAIMNVKTTTIDVQHQARGGGKSGYSLYRAAQLAFHVLVGYSDVPLKMVVILGAAHHRAGPGRAWGGSPPRRPIPTAPCRRWPCPPRCSRSSAAW